MLHEALLSSQSFGARMPLGRFDVIPSAVTGAPLRYFTPDPLPMLLARYLGECSSEASCHHTDQVLALLLARPAAADYSGNVDLLHANLIAEAALGHVSYTDVGAIVKLGSCISPWAKAPREEIVFSGATSASASTHVYPPHEAVPGLLDSLAGGLRSPPGGMDAIVFSAVVGFYCVHVHPFLDGNGRWGRVLATHAGASLQGGASGVMSAILQSRFKHMLVHSVWPSARRNGLKDYLLMARGFETALRDGIDPEVLELTRLVLAALKRHFVSRRDYKSAAIMMFTNGSFHAQTPSMNRFNLSEKRQRWLLEELSSITGTSLEHFFKRAADAANLAVENAQDSLKRSFK